MKGFYLGAFRIVQGFVKGVRQSLLGVLIALEQFDWRLIWIIWSVKGHWSSSWDERRRHQAGLFVRVCKWSTKNLTLWGTSQIKAPIQQKPDPGRASRAREVEEKGRRSTLPGNFSPSGRARTGGKDRDRARVFFFVTRNCHLDSQTRKTRARQLSLGQRQMQIQNQMQKTRAPRRERDLSRNVSIHVILRSVTGFSLKRRFSFVVSGRSGAKKTRATHRTEAMKT